MTDKKYYVNFGPELLKLLGPNLYTNIYYVLGEIIANAYDADAENVYILYNTDKNSIVIEDDGNGMTYDQFNDKFLPIGVTSRDDEESTYTEKFRRLRMGRKGIGKLAALSVAEQVKVTSLRDGEKSGCILSLNIIENNEGRYEIPPIDDSEITFNYITSHGSAIKMENSRYSIGKTIESAKRNISLIFPFASSTFQIHIENEKTQKKGIIDDAINDIIKQSDTLITFSDENVLNSDYFNQLHSYFEDGRYYKEIFKELPEDELPKKKELNLKKPTIRSNLDLTTINEEYKSFELVISGWIATYAVSNSKRNDNDFPSNYISLIANGKLGKFNILPEITTNRMGEAYVVGQFHVDLLEETELPDIASSNRQGYKEDDPRYRKTLELLQEKALKPILELKVAATEEKNYRRKVDEIKKIKTSKDEFDKLVREVIDNPDFKRVIKDSKPVKDAFEKGLGLKETLNESYKKVMISHQSGDKKLIDELEKILLYSGFESKEILYTNSDHFESRIQPYADIYEYLKDFFVNTTFKTDLCVIYILNNKFIKRWAPILEAGAGWVLNSTAYPMYTDKHNSVKKPFSTSEYTPRIAFNLTEIEARTLASAIYKIARHANVCTQDENSIFTFIKSTKLYKEK